MARLALRIAFNARNVILRISGSQHEFIGGRQVGQNLVLVVPR